MCDGPLFDLILLDERWRPVDRLPADWPNIVRHVLQANGRWVGIAQHRAPGSPVAPETRDFLLTRALYRRLRPLEIGLTDHIIRAGKERFSFRAAGLL